MPGDTGVSHGNSQIACRGALEDDACIDDRAVALHSLEGVAERLGRGCDIEEQSGLSEIEVASHLEAEKRLSQRPRRKLQECELARNADAGSACRWTLTDLPFSTEAAGGHTGPSPARDLHDCP